MTADDPQDRYRAPALDKGLDILELLSTTDEGLTQAEIAKQLGRSPNEIYRMLDRLVRRRYVARTLGDRYELTLKLFALAHRHAPVRRLVAQAAPAMRAFVRRAKQACHLAVFDRGRVVVVAQFDAPSYWSYAVRVGARISIYNTGAGHVLLAFSPPEERALMLEEYEMEPADRVPERLDDRLAEVRVRGYEQMPSVQTRGVWNLAVPVLGPNGRALAALACPYVERIEGDDDIGMEETLSLLIEAGREISATSGGLPE